MKVWIPKSKKLKIRILKTKINEGTDPKINKNEDMDPKNKKK